MLPRWRSAPPWWLKDVSFWAPLSDGASPVSLYRGTGPFTMARAGVATYFDYRTGVITSASANTLRIEADGALFEDARTNIMLQTDTSQDLLAQWTKTGITSAYENDASGFGGKRWTLTADGSDRQFVRSITIPAVAHSIAFYVRKADGSAVTSADCNIHADNAERASTYTSLGNSVYRVAFENFVGANLARNSGLTVKATKTVHVVGPPQLEAGAFCTSPVPTVGVSVTRSRDDLTITNTGGQIPQAAGTMFADCRVKALGSFNDIIANQTACQPFGKTNGNLLFAFDGTTLLSGPAWNDTNRHRVAVAWGAGTMNVAIDGTLGVAVAFDGAMFAAGDILAIAQNAVAGGNYFVGWIRMLMAFSRKFTDTEMQVLTR